MRPANKKNITTNTFSLGMRSDRTVYAQDKRSYRDAWNGNIIFAGSGGDAQFENELGTLLLEDLLPANYTPVGGREIGDRLVIFSVSNTGLNSEIGILSLNPDGTLDTYITAFNDEFDPNNDKLNFSTGFYIQPPEATRETVDKQIVYWTDRNNEPRSFNINTGLESVSPQFVQGDYEPLISSGKYPWFYSVHSMSLQPDFKMGTIKLQSALAEDGSLKTGMYEMSYRMVDRKGYNTPWYPLTRHYFVTLDADNPPTSDPLLNMHYRMMYASNVMTNKKYVFTIEDIDVRFYKLEMAYVYSTDKDVTVEACVFYSEVINPLTPNVDIDFAATTGIAINLAEFNKYIVPIRRCQTIGQKDNRLWVGGPETYGPFKLDLSGVTITPYMRQMLVDTREDAITLPITNMGSDDTNLTIQSYLNSVGASVTQLHTILDDYANYKGVLWEHLFSSYWGGETYPFFLVVFDLKGNPFFAQHIRDYTFPQRYDDPSYNIMTDENNINIMGVKFSNIDLTPILYDPAGKLQVSGFAITRGKRIPKTLCQGIVIPTMIKEDAADVTELMPSPTNDFHPISGGNADVVIYTNGLYKSNGQVRHSRPYTAQFLSPDIIFERNIYEGTSQDTVLEEADQLKIVGLQENFYNGEATDQNPQLFYKNYTKHYLNVADTNALIKMGTTTRIKRMLVIDTFAEKEDEWLGYDEDNLLLHFLNDANVDTGDGLYVGACTDNLHSKGVRQAWVVKTKDIKTATYYDSVASGSTKSQYYIANYIVNQDNYYTAPDQKSLGQRLSIGTGHFQPITQAVLDAIETGEEQFIFNGVEVWGGDCYPWTFDFVRLYPGFSGNCSHTGDCWSDYGHAVIVPLETSMNIALRRGRNYAKVGMRSEADACGYTDTGFDDGITIGQPENFFLNSVVMHEGNVQMFISLPDIVDPIITKFPYRWLWSNLKIYGEITDQYRVFLTGARGDMEPIYGAIEGRGYIGEWMYCMQQRAFSRLRLNEIKAISTESGEPIATGTIEIWQKPALISSIHGCIHPFGIINTDKGIYWPDHYNKCFVRFAQDGVTNLSEVCDQKQNSYDLLKFLDNEQRVIEEEIRHIAGGWDPVRNLIYWSMLAKYRTITKVEQTIVFAEDDHVNAFVSNFNFVADLFVSCKSYLISYNSINVYVHNKGDYGLYYETLVDTKIKFIANDIYDADKLFDNSWASLNPDAYILLKQINWVTENQTQVFTLFKHFYQYSSNVAATDPGSGLLKFNNVTLALATLLHISETDGGANNLSELINKWSKIMVFKNTDITQYAIYQVTDIVDNGTWDTLTLTFIEGNGSFTNLDQVSVVVLDTQEYSYHNLLFEVDTMARAAVNHLSGKHLSIEFIFTNAKNKKITFISHDQSWRLIAKTR